VRQRRFVRGGSVSIWTFSQKTFLLVVSRCTLLIVRQSGKRLSRRRAMRRRKRASLDVRRIPSTRERRRNMSQCCCERGMRAFAATPSERRAIAEQATPCFCWSLGGKATVGFPARYGAHSASRQKCAYPSRQALGHTMPTFLRARNASNVERRTLAPPPRALA
jgi:hypothetical protein